MTEFNRKCINGLSFCGVSYYHGLCQHCYFMENASIENLRIHGRNLIHFNPRDRKLFVDIPEFELIESINFHKKKELHKLMLIKEVLNFGFDDIANYMFNIFYKKIGLKYFSCFYNFDDEPDNDLSDKRILLIKNELLKKAINSEVNYPSFYGSEIYIGSKRVNYSRPIILYKKINS